LIIKKYQLNVKNIIKQTIFHSGNDRKLNNKNRLFNPMHPGSFLGNFVLSQILRRKDSRCLFFFRRGL